jgi:TfoX/Sxy family transcriptional regulator of competence genes
MAYDERLAERLRATTDDVLGSGTAVVEKKMFGGLALMVDGTMACGVYQDADLRRWVQRSTDYARTLPPK